MESHLVRPRVQTYYRFYTRSIYQLISIISVRCYIIYFVVFRRRILHWSKAQKLKHLLIKIFDLIQNGQLSLRIVSQKKFSVAIFLRRPNFSLITLLVSLTSNLPVQKISFDSNLSGNNCLNSKLLSEHDFSASIPSILIYSNGVIKKFRKKNFRKAYGPLFPSKYSNIFPYKKKEILYILVLLNSNFWHQNYQGIYHCFIYYLKSTLVFAHPSNVTAV